MSLTGFLSIEYFAWGVPASGVTASHYPPAMLHSGPFPLQCNRLKAHKLRSILKAPLSPLIEKMFVSTTAIS